MGLESGEWRIIGNKVRKVGRIQISCCLLDHKKLSFNSMENQWRALNRVLNKNKID